MGKIFIFIAYHIFFPCSTKAILNISFRERQMFSPFVFCISSINCSTWLLRSSQLPFVTGCSPDGCLKIESKSGFGCSFLRYAEKLWGRGGTTGGRSVRIGIRGGGNGGVSSSISSSCCCCCCCFCCCVWCWDCCWLLFVDFLSSSFVLLLSSTKWFEFTSLMSWKLDSSLTCGCFDSALFIVIDLERIK